MPTQQVDPTSGELLQEVANALLKSRKVIVITGAGISTNSGIPDFRSENGLYSLIQAQLDAAERRERKSATQEEVQCASTSNDDHDGNDSQSQAQSHSPSDNNDDDDHESERASKRRRTSREGSVHITPQKPQDDALFLPPLRPFEGTTPLRPEPQYFAAAPVTSPLSSPPADFHSSAYRPRQFDFLRGSSPFGPSESSSSSPTPSRRSSVSDSGSEVEGPSISKKLPNMKGKDLFDASIWADPLRTKVFYTFTTTLRQKSRDCVPTSSHHFISHLKTQGKLLRCYTQNIDRIEEKVGLSTELLDGPGSRARFRKSTSNASQLAKMADESKDTPPSSQLSSSQPSASQPSLSSQPSSEGDSSKSSGVECVYLHGSLEQLRCFQCKRTSSWDDTMEEQTMSGLQPECPHCTEATVAREEKGKRALGVGKLRPDIVLYGEEHPSSHLIGPLVEHDIKLCRGANVLLILGTSLKVHGLKFLVREFANAIHNKNGKVIFVNFTKPPESIWSEIIDYWVQWDCDAWVTDLQQRVPQLWEGPQPPKKKPPPANPVAFRDTRLTGAFWTDKIHRDLLRITGRPLPPKVKQKAVVAARPVLEETTITTEVKEVACLAADPTVAVEPETKSESRIQPKGKGQAKATKPRSRKPRKSAPAVIQQPTPDASSSPSGTQIPSSPRTAAASPTPGRDIRHQLSSILNSVKENPRIRKRKKLDGEEVTLPVVNRRRNTLAPMVNVQPPVASGRDAPPRPMPLEPASPPYGPVQAFSSNFSTTIGRVWNNGMQRFSQLFDSSSYQWNGSSSGFGGGMIDPGKGPYQFRSGIRPRQQVAPAEVSRVEAHRHDARERDTALVMAEMGAPRRRSRLPR